MNFKILWTLRGLHAILGEENRSASLKREGNVPACAFVFTEESASGGEAQRDIRGLPEGGPGRRRSRDTMSQLSVSAREAINRFLIEDFNYILRAEEKALSSYEGAALSVNEFHIIESVLRAEQEEQNTMGEISRRLGVTMGTLTTAVKTLEKKGCLLRRRSVEDKRVVRLEATEKGKEADQYHQRFHTAMVEAVAGCLSEEQLITLTGALSVLAGYFSHYSRGKGDFPPGEEERPLPVFPGKQEGACGKGRGRGHTAVETPKG